MSSEPKKLNDIDEIPAAWQSEDSRARKPARLASPDTDRRPRSDERRSSLELAMSILAVSQQLTPVLNLYQRLSKDPDSAPPEEKEEFATQFGNLFRDLYARRFSRLPRELIRDSLFIDESSLQRLEKGQATYEEAIDLLAPMLFLLEESSPPGNVQ